MAPLPYLGLGLSTNLGASDLPDPFRLIDQRPGLFDFVEYSAPLSFTQAQAEAALLPELVARRGRLPAIFHPVHLNLYGPELESDERIAALQDHLSQIGSPWVGNDVGWWHHGGAPFPGYLYLPPPLSEAGLSDCAAHALNLQAKLDRPLLLENPALLAKSGPLHVLDFMAELHRRTGLGLILDLGHLLSHQLSRGLPLKDGLDGFPLEQVIEIHLAGGVVTTRGARRFYVDDHTQAVREELFMLLEDLLPRCVNLRAVTFEGDGHPAQVATLTLERLRAIVPPLRESTVTMPPPKPPVPLRRETNAWSLYDAAYGERGVIEDPEGARADTDFRLAVIAERLDREFPLMRLLLAGTRAQLVSFAGSPEFRSLFDGTGRALPQVFASWARGVLRARRIPSLDGVLAFELWQQHELSHAVPVTVTAGMISLAPGVKVGSFARDLSELLFAASGLRRHLAGRALASGAFEQTAIDALLQVAERARAGSWQVALRRTSRGVDPLSVDDSLSVLLRAIGKGQPWPAFGSAPGLSRETLDEALGEGLLTVTV